MRRLLLSTALCLFLPAVANPQDAGFDAANAVLDTSRPFVAGAREANQQLRGSFGWPTFQEGVINGIYYRFDPDGYARFGANPRLDVDIFEVICRPGTVDCAARKGGLLVTLTQRGNLHLAIEDLAPHSEFALSDGVSVLPLPDRVLQPLDKPLENLLLAGQELIVTSGSQDRRVFSLVGLEAVAAYLRWVAARQDPSVLPPGWPVAAGEAQQVTASAPVLGPIDPDGDGPAQRWARIFEERNAQAAGAGAEAGVAAVPQPAAAQPVAQPSAATLAVGDEIAGRLARIEQILAAGGVAASSPGVVAAQAPGDEARLAEAITRLAEAIADLQKSTARLSALYEAAGRDAALSGAIATEPEAPAATSEVEATAADAPDPPAAHAQTASADPPDAAQGADEVDRLMMALLSALGADHGGQNPRPAAVGQAPLAASGNAVPSEPMPTPTAPGPEPVAEPEPDETSGTAHAAGPAGADPGAAEATVAEPGGEAAAVAGAGIGGPGSTVEPIAPIGADDAQTVRIDRALLAEIVRALAVDGGRAASSASRPEGPPAGETAETADEPAATADGGTSASDGQADSEDGYAKLTDYLDAIARRQNLEP